MYWRALGNQVLANHDVNTNLSDDGSFDIEIFKEFNKDQRNIESHTVIVENELAEIWATVLEARYGKPETKEKGCGLIFRHWISSTLKFTITLYVKPKTDPRSKLHIQSPSQVLNDDYVFIHLPAIYDEVRKQKIKAISESEGRNLRSKVF